MLIKLRDLAMSFVLVAMLLSAMLAPLSAQVNARLYSESASPAADIAAASAQARREHKRILLDFGANWCGDCQVLNLYSMQGGNTELLARHYVVVHVDVGHMDHNIDIARKYEVPITRGIPALAVLDAHGKLLYAEREKEFEHTSPEALTAFLNRWKGN